MALSDASVSTTKGTFSLIIGRAAETNLFLSDVKAFRAFSPIEHCFSNIKVLTFSENCGNHCA